MESQEINVVNITSCLWSGKLDLWSLSQVTANAKDPEVIKKVCRVLAQSPEKLKYFSLKIAQMEMFTLGKSEKNISNKKISLV